jgi:hypothetical protein
MVVTEVVEKANKALENLLGALENLPAESQTVPKTIGEWSIRDLLAHLIAWEEEAAKAFEIWKIGVEPDWGHIKDIDDFNARAIKDRRKLSYAKTVEQLQIVHGGVIDNIKSVSDSEFARRGGVPRWLANLIIDHLNEHTERILSYKSGLESEVRAEQSN